MTAISIETALATSRPDWTKIFEFVGSAVGPLNKKTGERLAEVAATLLRNSAGYLVFGIAMKWPDAPEVEILWRNADTDKGPEDMGDLTVWAYNAYATCLYNEVYGSPNSTSGERDRATQLYFGLEEIE